MNEEREIVYAAREAYATGPAYGRFRFGVVPQYQLLLGSDPIVQAHPDKWIAFGAADRDAAERIADLGLLAVVGSALLPPLGRLPVRHDAPAELEPEPVNDMGDLPGGLTWDRIESTYRKLASESSGLRHRRRRIGEPSRPELAKALHISAPTLKRACVAAGKGSKWPPAGL
jgi:hypothetical protein